MNARKATRIEQLKDKIARLETENAHLKKLLSEKITEDFIKTERNTLDFFAQHLTVETKPAYMEKEGDRYLWKIPRPIVKWDGNVIP